MTSGLAAPTPPKHTAPHEQTNLKKVSSAMLEATLVTTTVKFGSQPPANVKTEVVSPQPQASVSSFSQGGLVSPVPMGSLLHWDCDQYPDSATKFSPIKLEPSDSLDGMGLSQNSTSEFAELKPMTFDYGITTLTGLDPVLANSSNNNNKTMVNMNSSSNSSNNNNHHHHHHHHAQQHHHSNNPTAVSTGSSSSSLHNHNTGSSTVVGSTSRTAPTSSSNHHYPTSSSADVTSTATSSPPGITKLETLDFTASQDAFDDLASIVGISMGADSTVPTMESDLDLDAWIENTAQNIKPLMPDGSLDNMMSGPRHCVSSNTLTVSSQSYLQMSQSSPSSTLQSLLQGNLTPHPPSAATKVTQLQQREDGHPSSGGAPPPYSILQTRLQHGSLSGPLQPPQNTHSNIVKVDSTFDLMKLTDQGGNGGGGGHPYLTSNFSDTLPHSTQTLLNHVSTSADQSLHRRLGELSGLAKMKAKQNKIRQKLGLNGVNGVPTGSSSSSGVGSPGDQSKKMMHHCQICNRGFLNKSNIKVHLRTHTGEKPFKCEHCSKAFRQKAHLLKHMSIHKRISRD
eukprot:snap_masked-scaffold33_size549341-processed-gene-1.12 protein:Tk11536 transcript:snap_masked-scaffold33_size549341-processed-gene-1.12-mRNA-1 annotation:"hypothetical protein KGM_06311"